MDHREALGSRQIQHPADLFDLLLHGNASRGHGRVGTAVLAVDD